METIKDILNFCMSAIFHTFTNIGITCELNQVIKFLINTFHKTIPDNINRVSLSIFDDKILKINNNDIENVIENIHDLRENILYMLAVEKLIGDEQQIVRPILIDDDDQEQLHLFFCKCL